ncbi:MAG: hypothetical protein R6T90_03170 [Dissulfuribacterales bacterium]
MRIISVFIWSFTARAARFCNISQKVLLNIQQTAKTAGFFICLFTYYDRVLHYAARPYQVIREIVNGLAAVIGDNPTGNVTARQRRKEGHGKQE